MIHFDFEENFAFKDRQVLGFSLRQRGNPFKSEIEIEGVTCDRSFANLGSYGRNYDAQNGNIALADGPRGKAGVFNPNSQMAIYGARPHAHGNMVSYALWLKTASEEDMVLDIGCGTGHVSLALGAAYPNSQFIGVDLDIGSIKKAKVNNEISINLSSFDLVRIFKFSLFSLFLIIFIRRPTMRETMSKYLRVIVPSTLKINMRSAKKIKMNRYINLRI